MRQIDDVHRPQQKMEPDEPDACLPAGRPVVPAKAARPPQADLPTVGRAAESRVPENPVPHFCLHRVAGREHPAFLHPQTVGDSFRRSGTKPRLLGQVSKPDFSRLPFVLLSYLRPVFTFISNRRVLLSVALGLGVTVWLVVFVVAQRSAKSDSGPSDTSALTAHNRAIKETLTQSNTPLAVDFTFNIQLNINGQPQAIPANYGQSESGKHIFNSSSTSGDIHVQSLEDTNYTLGDFFVLWGGQFSQQCLLNHCSSEPGMLKMTVNNQPNDKYHNYIIQPNDRIVITYGQ